MDRLTAFVVSAHLKLRLDQLLRHPHLLERDNMATPNLQSLTTAMDMLEHELEADAGKLLTKVQAVRERGKAAIGKGHARIDGVAGRVGEVEKFVTAIEGSNGGDPLDGSSNFSGKEAGQREQQPDAVASAAAAGSSGETSAVAETSTAPEELTINGVSKER